MRSRAARPAGACQCARSLQNAIVGDGIDELQDGWTALRAGHWQAARAWFSGAIESNATPEAFEGLSWAAWWLDDAEAMFEARERAFRLYRERGDGASAARMAAWLASDELDFHGALAVASGWIDRARRLLESMPLGPDHGWVVFHQGFVAMMAGDADAVEEHGVRAAELGRAFDVPDLEMLGLALQGSTLVSRARVREGMRCLDEACAIALAGEATIPISGAWTFCFLVTACTWVHDFERASEWCDRIAGFAERYGSRYMLGYCRAEYAAIHLWRGEWAEAEDALKESIAAFSASRAPLVGGPVAELAELRRRQGRTEEAEQLLDRAGASPRAQLCRAELALDRGDPARALDLAERVLRAADDDRPFQRLAALHVLARARIASGRMDDAASAVEALVDIAEAADTTALRARAAFARGVLAVATGDPERAKSLLEDALDGFEPCGGRFDAACTRIELAKVLISMGRPEEGRREAREAHECLRELGAGADAERARRLLRESEAGGLDQPQPVSPREREVLCLLVDGLTNREISGRLFISEHTVHRHVTNILRKLNVPSRAAAAAYAVRAGVVGGSGE